MGSNKIQKGHRFRDLRDRHTVLRSPPCIRRQPLLLFTVSRVCHAALLLLVRDIHYVDGAVRSLLGVSAIRSLEIVQ